jgi:hypothetical protein
MLRAKAVSFKRDGVRGTDRFLTSTDKVGMFAGIPIVTRTINAVNRTAPARAAMETTMGMDRTAWRPDFAPKKFRSAARPNPTTAAGRRCKDARQGRRLLDLLHQLQRAGHRPRSGPHSRAQRDPARSRKGGVLRHAEARNRRPRRRGSA